MTPNVLAPEAWWLDDVQGDLDAMVLTCQRLDGETPATMQRDALSTLLAPRDLFAILERRIGGVPAPGTVLLSGTIGGEPEAGAANWWIALEEPATGRRIAHAYTVEALPAELVEPSAVG